MKKRVLFVGAEASFFASHRLPLALAARDAGYDVHVATPRGPRQEVIAATGLPWHEILLRRRIGYLRDPLSIVQCTLLYRRLRPDLVHHVAVKTVLFGMIAARLARVPAVVNAVTGLGSAFDEHRLVARVMRIACEHLFEHPRMRFTFENADDLDVFLRRGWIEPEEAVLIRGTGVDPVEFAPPEQPPAGPPLVLFASRLLASKGVGEFCEAARRLRARGLEARFAVAGTPDPQNPETVSASDISRWKSEGAVEMLGARQDMAALMRAASVFVLPTYYREGVPKALMEAAATAVAAVTTDTPGCRDIVVDGVTGLLVPPRDPDALTSAIEQLLCDAEKRRAMGLRARERVLAHFSVARVAERTHALYESLLRS